MSNEKNQKLVELALEHGFDTYVYGGGPNGSFTVIGTRESCETIGRLTRRVEQLTEALQETADEQRQAQILYSAKAAARNFYYTREAEAEACPYQHPDDRQFWQTVWDTEYRRLAESDI